MADTATGWQAGAGTTPSLAAASLAGAVGAGDGPVRRPAPTTAAPRRAVLPEAPIDGLSSDRIGEALATAGCLVVRGLLDPTDACATAAAVRRACAERDRFLTGDPSPDACHFVPLTPDRGGGAPLDFLRQVARQCEAVLVAEAPAVLAAVLAMLRESGLLDTVGAHLGELPALSLDKTIARCVPTTLPCSTVDAVLFPSWHQDGVGWPRAARAVNVWVALDECGPGTGRRGVELHPAALDDFIPDGWSSNDPADGPAHLAALAELHEAAPPVVPSLAAGDAVVFDQRTLHRTEADRPFSGDRVSIELWLLAPSTFPPGLTPLALQRRTDASAGLPGVRP